jgi:hypothetical protein
MAFLFGWIGGVRESNERKGSSYLISVTIVAVDGLAVANAGPLNPTSLLASRNDCPRQVASLKAMMHLLPLAVPDGKAILDPTHLPSAVSGGFDQQRRNRARCQMLWHAPANTHGVEPVRFWNEVLLFVQHAPRKSKVLCIPLFTERKPNRKAPLYFMPGAADTCSSISTYDQRAFDSTSSRPKLGRGLGMNISPY